MAAYISLFISLVSLILMIVILIRFKKLFSTDSIIEKTKSQMNRVIIDVNNNANRDIELINESSRRLRALLNEADVKMEHFREASQLLRDTIAEAEKTGKSHRVNPSYINTIPLDPDAAFEIKKKGPAKQGSLFDETEDTSLLKDETVITSDGAAFKEVPLIVTKVYDEEPQTQASKKAQTSQTSQMAQASQTSQTAKVRQPFQTVPVQNTTKTLKDKVEKLFRQGMQVDDIAMELSCPSSEVQFIIDML